MKISVIIPVYNVSAYIERCILSVMHQTYKGEMECIIVDDCSPDDSILKCRNLIETYQGCIKFKITTHSVNQGLSVARNTGTEQATGDYIYYLDSDDELYPDTIKILAAKVEEFPEIDMVIGAVNSIPKTNSYDLEDFYAGSMLIDNHKLRFFSYKSGNVLYVNAWNKLIKKEILLINNISFYPRLIHEDQLWWAELILNISSCVLIKDKTYVHYRTEGSIMDTITQQIETDNWYVIIREFITKIDIPFRDLQVLKFLRHYFEFGINISFGKHNDGIYDFFIKSLFTERMYKGVFLFFCWHSLLWFRNGWRFNSWLYDYLTKEHIKRTADFEKVIMNQE